MKSNFIKCKNCKNRYPGCHSSCKTYQETKIEYGKEKEKIRTIKRQEGETSGYYRERNTARLHRERNKNV